MIELRKFFVYGDWMIVQKTDKVRRNKNNEGTKSGIGVTIGQFAKNESRFEILKEEQINGCNLENETGLNVDFNQCQ